MTRIQAGTRVRQASGATGVVTRVGDRITIYWDRGTGNTLNYTPADVAARFTVVAPPPDHRSIEGKFRAQARELVRSMPPRMRNLGRCPNPRDCGDPTCQGDCGY